jgi:hypothetical protein
VNLPEPRRIRVGHAERDQAVTELGEHLSAGRLDPDEYADRTVSAYAARTCDELEALFTDLPRPVPAELPAVHPAPTAVAAAAPYPVTTPHAPHGIDPRTGMPYSDRSRVVAGVLQLVLPFGVGRFYSGHHGIAVAQLLLSFVGIGVLWAFVDGIVILVGRPTDPHGRPLRP